MTRDRFTTRALILESAAAIVSSRGVPALRINSLADAASCDKVLIYRYFDGLDGVLEALGAERMLWPRVALPDDSDSGHESLADAVRSLLLEEWAALSGASLMLAAAGAELSRGGETLSAPTAEQRAALHLRMIAGLRERYAIPPYVDLAALVELLSASLTAFALRAAHSNAAMASRESFDPSSPAGWRRIEKVLTAITRALLDPRGE